jgi:DNA-binding transcriptional ArsR family regulator
VEHLQHGSLSVGQLCDRVGIEQANASQHLAVLRNRHIVQTRKEGNQIFYSLRDPLLGQLLEVLRQYFLSHINEALAMLREEEKGAEPGLANQEAER